MGQRPPQVLIIAFRSTQAAGRALPLSDKGSLGTPVESCSPLTYALSPTLQARRVQARRVQARRMQARPLGTQVLTTALQLTHAFFMSLALQARHMQARRVQARPLGAQVLTTALKLTHALSLALQARRVPRLTSAHWAPQLWTMLAGARCT